MTSIVVAYNVTNPETGLTWRQENMLKQHTIPIDAIVEMLPYGEGDDDYNEHTGLRLYVVQHGRDCDGTPLYTLSCYHKAECDRLDEFAKKCVVEAEDGTLRVRGELLMRNYYITGVSEESIKLISGPRDFSKFK